MSKLPAILAVLWKLFQVLWGMADEDFKKEHQDLVDLAKLLSEKVK